MLIIFPYALQARRGGIIWGRRLTAGKVVEGFLGGEFLFLERFNRKVPWSPEWGSEGVSVISIGRFI